MVEHEVDVVVVGTGWNGLIAAQTYLKLSPQTNLLLLDEQASIGGVWSREKVYPSLFAQIKYGLFEYSFYPMRREGVTDDGYISGETINVYLNEFARDHDLVRRARLRTKVIKVERLTGERGWRLELEGKPSLECAKLIYASGATSHPVVPSWPTAMEFNIPIVHSSEIGIHLDALAKIRRATIVGSAKSAYDAVFLLLQYGVKVDWVIRRDGSGLLAIMPPTILGLVNSMDVISTKAMSILGSSIMSTKGLTYELFQKTWLGRKLAETFWKTTTKIAELHAGYSRSENAQHLRPLPHGNGIFWANAGLGCASVPDFWKVFHAGDCTVHRTEISELSQKAKVSLKSGVAYDTDYIILCTGFDKSYHPFSVKLQQECGLLPDPDPLEDEKWTCLDKQAEEIVDDLLPALKDSPVPESIHEKVIAVGDMDVEDVKQEKQPTELMHGPSRHYRRLVVPRLAAQGDRSIYFPGFIHSIYTPLVSEVQALWGVAFLTGQLDVPTRQVMEKEVAEWNVWCRKRYLAQGRKHAYAIYDFLPYIDMLLGDLGINSVRRSNPLFDLFTPAYPRSYRGLVDEFRCAYAKRLGFDTNSAWDAKNVISRHFSEKQKR